MKSTKKRFEQSIGNKIFLVVIPVMIITSILLSSFYYATTKKELLSVSQNLLMQVAKDTASLVQTEIRANAQLSEDIANYLTLKQVTEREDILEILREKEKDYDFKTLAFVDPEGNYIDTKGNRTNIRETDHFQMSIGGTRAASELYISSIDNSLEVAYCAPISINNEIIGVVATTKDGLEYSNIANSMDIGYEAFSFILDRATGQILASPDNDLVRNLTTMDNLVKQDKKYVGLGKAAEEMIANVQGITSYKFEGEKKLVVHTGILSDYWVLGVVVNEDVILQSSKKIGIYLMGLTLVAIIVASLIVFLLSRNIGKSFKKLRNNINEIAKGNFSQALSEDLKQRNDEIGEIARAVENINVNMSYMIKNIKDLSEQVDVSSKELNNISENLTDNNENIATVIHEVAKGNSTQTKNISDITIKLDEFNTLLTDMDTCIEAVGKVASEIDSNAKESNSDMFLVTQSIQDLVNKFERFIEMMTRMENKFKNITTITGLIEEISNKTNLLSLNAAIESARAGEAGRGFSVVAEEIGKLAVESSQSTKKIDEMVDSILDEIQVLTTESNEMGSYMNEQKDSLDKAILSFEQISHSIDKIQPIIHEVAGKAKEVNKEKQEILLQVDEIVAISEEVTASAEEIAATTEEVTTLSNGVEKSSKVLVELTDKMKVHIDHFKI